MFVSEKRKKKRREETKEKESEKRVATCSRAYFLNCDYGKYQQLLSLVWLMEVQHALEVQIYKEVEHWTFGIFFGIFTP